MKSIIPIQIPVWLAACASVLGQGAFFNLDFEAAVIPPGQPSNTQLPISSAMPGWEVLVGGDAVTTVLFDAVTIGSSGASLVTPATAGGASIEGTYSAALQAGLGGFPQAPLDVAISQTGLVPDTALSLVFLARPGFGDFAVSLNGQVLPLTMLASYSTHHLYGADITSFSGQSMELRFVAFANPDGRLNDLFLDDIQFLDVAIPEPSVLGLLLLGSLAVGWRCFQRGL